jgi:hypothetical protein
VRCAASLHPMPNTTSKHSCVLARIRVGVSVGALVFNFSATSCRCGSRSYALLSARSLNSTLFTACGGVGILYDSNMVLCCTKVPDVGTAR